MSGERGREAGGSVFWLVRQDTGAVIAHSVGEAHGRVDRALGLMLRRPLAPGEGIWLTPCNGVHTFFMRFAIDVIVLNRDLRTVQVARSVPPWRILIGPRGGHSTVELAAGTLKDDLPVGTQLAFVRANASH